MARGDNYENLEITIDTREKDTIENQKKNNTRMKIISDFFDSLGASVERSKVDYCDYAIRGTFFREDKSYDINLGIQYKLLGGDLFPSLPTLPEVLFRAHSSFSSVALIVEENGGYELLMDLDQTDGQFQNYAMQASCERTGTGRYSSYKNFMQSMAECKIQARAIRSNQHFPMEVTSIMKYIIKPSHDGLAIRPTNQYEELSNCFARFPGIGAASVDKLLQYIPNMERLCDLQVDELQNILGPLKGKQLHHFLHNTDRKEICAKNWLALDVPKPKLIEEKAKPKKISKKKIVQDLPGTVNVAEQTFHNTPNDVPHVEHIAINSSVSAPLISTVPVPSVKVYDTILEVLEDHPVSMTEIKELLGFSEELIFFELKALEKAGRIYKDKATRLWYKGLDPFIIKDIQHKDLDIGV